MSIFFTALLRMLTTRRPQRPPHAERTTPSAKDHASGAAMLEVERKFKIRDGESTTIPTRLKAMGFEATVSIEMTDQFLPTGVKGEMLRVRDELANGKHTTVVTIKEWVNIGNNRERREQEAGISALQRWILLLVGRLISRAKLPAFSKTRLMHASPVLAGVVIAIDDVQGLGDNSGHYAEVEVLVPQDGDVDGARAQIFGLARELFGEEREFVQASYQDMLKLASTKA